MDKTLFYVSLFLLLIGIGGQLSWYFFAGVPCNPPGGNPYLFGSACDHTATQASFQEMENISGYMMIIGLILLPAGLFKDGLPSPGYVAKIIIGFLLVTTIAVAFTGALLVPHSSTSTTPTATPETFVSILPGSANPGTLITFSPQNITVVIGVNNTVEWTNNDTAAHTVTSRPGAPASFNQVLSPGQTFVYTFTTAGTYNYYCTFHSWMHGTVTVKLK